MKLTCYKCGTNHKISDSKLSDKEQFGKCIKCGATIIVPAVVSANRIDQENNLNEKTLPSKNDRGPLDPFASDPEGAALFLVKAFGVVFSIVLVFAVIASINRHMEEGDKPSSPPSNMTLSEEYPGPWMEDADTGIVRALIKNNIRGCGSFKYRESSQNPHEYLVRCMGYDIPKSYIVWVGIDKVNGPFRADSSLH